VEDSILEQLASPEWLVARIKDSNAVDKKFLQFYLSSPEFRDWISRAASSVTGSHSRAKANDILQRDIPLPPIDEQHKIVELLEDHLSRLDTALVDVKQAKIKAAQFRRSLLQAAFTGNLGFHRALSLTEIPSDWSWVTLDEAMSECKNGLTYRNKPELAGFPVSRIETISKGEIDFQKVGYGGVSLEGNQKHVLIPGDILFSHINSMLHVGKVAIYKSGMPPLLHGMNLLRITPSDDFVPEFLFHLFQSSDVRKQIWSKAKHAVNQASINIGELKTVIVPKPPIEEQQKIVEILEGHLSRLAGLVALAEVMEKQSNGLRRSLLQAAFTGQLTKEVASV
jgi:restriction endonuclease S subunit